MIENRTSDPGSKLCRVELQGAQSSLAAQQNCPRQEQLKGGVTGSLATAPPRQVLLVSRHDYRTDWRANFHPLADALSAMGAKVTFVSTGYSRISKWRGDRRVFLDRRANQWERVNGIDCYLWKSVVHPFRTGCRSLDRAAVPLFKLWANSPCRALDESAAAADVIIVESDLSAVLLQRLRKVAPQASIIYIASDMLDTIGAAPQIGRALIEQRQAIDHVVVVSRGMMPLLAGLGRPMTYVPHGIVPSDFSETTASPYDAPRIAVSVGSMLFDREVIEIAAEALTDWQFHLIGTPSGGAYPSNVFEHGQMPFKQTVPWLRNADIGIAPYRRTATADYLADSSMKLMQYNYLGLPAVCPDFAVGDHPLRFGYVPGEPASILAAFATARASERGVGVAVQTWRETAAKICSLAR